MTAQEKQTLAQILESFRKVTVTADEQSMTSMLWATLAIKSMIGGGEANGNTGTESRP